MCNYTPFGWSIPSRKINKGKIYKYSFNGVEQDQEWHGSQSMAFEFRTYDPRIGRFLSTDPLTATTPGETPYAFAGNSPIANIDYLGLSRTPANGGNGKVERFGFFKRLGNTLSGKGYLNKANKYASENNIQGWQITEKATSIVINEAKLTSPSDYSSSEVDGSYSYSLETKETTFSKRGREQAIQNGGSALTTALLIGNGAGQMATAAPIPHAKVAGYATAATVTVGVTAYLYYQSNITDVLVDNGGSYAYAPPQAPPISIPYDYPLDLIHEDGNKEITLFRGVKNNHQGAMITPSYWIVTPWGRDPSVTAKQHNSGNNSGNWTSWTPNIHVANYFAKPTGTILKRKFTVYELLIHGAHFHNKYSLEFDVQLYGPIVGHETVKPWASSYWPYKPPYTK